MPKPAALLAALCLILLPIKSHAEDVPASVRNIVAAAVAPLMQRYGIPGMAVGVVIDQHIYVCNYGLASKATGQPVNANTLFEIGSISKTFNATLATYAQARGALALSGMASKYLPALQGSAFDRISLRDLGTYTPGGLPLQVPNGVNNNTQLMAYLKAWKPAYAPGTTRLYSNISIGLFGFIAATSLHADYATLLQSQMFPALRLTHSFMDIPAAQAANYAQGYEQDGTPIRMSEGPLGPEAYGVRTTAGDLTRFIAINMGMFQTDPAWQKAVISTHTGYDQLQDGKMIQDLAWEQYTLPVSLAQLQAGNGSQAMGPAPVTPFAPPLSPQTDVLLNKTGSTNGFAAYVAYVPAHQMGVVLLANRSYPIPARVSAAYEILTRLDAESVKQ